MRADCFHEPQRLPGVELQTAFLCVFEVIQMTLNGELNVAACDDVVGQNGVVVAADMVSG